MWSLPDINAGNKAAAVAAKKNKNKTEAQLCKGQTCDHCGEKATHALPYYDVFSDDIKGYIFSCDEHEEGAGEEGYFICNECGLLHIENYTWEVYSTIVDEEQLCLNCALDRYMKAEENWVKDASRVTPELVRKSPHLIPNSGEHWKKSLIFLGNVGFDNTNGECISGGGDGELQELARKGIESHGKVMLILDSAYQFAVSVGVYVSLPKAQGKRKKAA
jgi:hypothetical protein